MTDEQKWIVDGGRTVAGQFPTVLSKAHLSAWIRKPSSGAGPSLGQDSTIRGLLAAFCSTTATNLNSNAFRYSSVADVAVIFAAAPFLTAGLGWLWLGVKEPWTTLIASLVVLSGVTIMVGGAGADGHLSGDVLAFGITLHGDHDADHSRASRDADAAGGVS